MRISALLAASLSFVIFGHIARADEAVTPPLTGQPTVRQLWWGSSFPLNDLLDLISAQYDIPLVIDGDIDGKADISNRLNLGGLKPKAMLELIAKTFSINLTWVPDDVFDPIHPDGTALLSKGPFPLKTYPIHSVTAQERTLGITGREINLTELIDWVGRQRKDDFAVLICGDIDGYAEAKVKSLSAQVPGLMKLSPDEQLEKIAQIAGVFLTKIPKDHCFIFTEKPFVP